MNPFVFEPELNIGGRMPHFWLLDDGGQRRSVLDLPTMMKNRKGDIHHVMLLSGKNSLAAQDHGQLPNLPIVTVHVSQSRLPGKSHFRYYLRRPSFLPASFAILIRPDGHIAWLQIP